jgi:hypothetical protein
LKERANVLIEDECILKNKNKSRPYKNLSVFYNSCQKTSGSHLVYTFMITYRFCLHRMRNVSNIFAEKIKAHILHSITSF